MFIVIFQKKYLIVSTSFGISPLVTTSIDNIVDVFATANLFTNLVVPADEKIEEEWDIGVLDLGDQKENQGAGLVRKDTKAEEMAKFGRFIGIPLAEGILEKYKYTNIVERIKTRVNEILSGTKAQPPS